jgi:tetratricopeptide (TPR) repeat protein
LSDSEVFVGRQPELALLEAALAGALAGHGGVVLVAGEAGSGKTSLLRAFLARAEPVDASLVTAWGDCSDVEGQSDPYLPFREVLSLLTGDFEDAPDKTAVSKENRGRLRAVLTSSGQILVDVAPDLINVILPGSRVVALMGKAVAKRVGWLEKLEGLSKKPAQESAVGDPSLTQDHIFEEVTAFLGKLSEVSPLVIVLDDLQWADAASTGLLFHLGRRIADRRILLLGAYRPDDLAQGPEGARHPLEHVINEFKRTFGEVIIDLSSGAGTQNEAFVNQVIDAEPNRLDADFRHELYERTEGHPLFVVELLRMLRERGNLTLDENGQWVAQPDLDWTATPPRVEGVIQERLARLEEADRQILQVASVEGDVFTAEVAADVLSLEPRQAVAELTDLLDPSRGLIRSAGTRRVESGRLSQYQFHHHLVREHIYQSIDPAQRAYLHEDVAASLTQRFAGELDDIAGALARHYEQAGLLDQAVRFGRMAGDRAYRMNAYQDALTHYGGAAALLDHVSLEMDELIDLYQHWGRALELTGQSQQAFQRYQDLEAMGDQRGEAHIRLAALAAQVVLLAIPSSLHDPNKGRELAAQALELAKELGDGAMQAKLLWSLSLIGLFGGQTEEAINSGEQALALARSLDLKELQAYILNDLTEPYAARGEVEKAEQAAAEAIELWKSLDNQPMLAGSIARRARLALYPGELQAAKDMAEEALGIGRKVRNLGNVSFALTLLGLSLFEQGELSPSLEALQEAYRLGDEVGNALATTGVRAEAAWVLAYLGSFEQAIQLAEQAVAAAREIYPPALPWTLAILTRIRLLAGETLDDLSSGEFSPMALTDQIVNHSAIFLTLAVGCAVAETAFAGGDLDQAKEAAEAWIEILEGRNARLYLPDAWTLRGRILLAQGKLDEARRAFQSAADLAGEIGSNRAAWPALAELAELEAATGEAEASRLHLMGARSALDHLLTGIHDETHKKSFTARPEVKALLDKAGPVVDGGV